MRSLLKIILMITTSRDRGVDGRRMNILRSDLLNFVRLWSRRLWSDKADGRDVLGPLFSSDHPIDYGWLWGPGRLLHGLLLGSPHLLDLLVDGLLLLLLPGGQGEDGEPATSSSSLLTTLPSQMVPPPTHQLPPRPSLVQVAQPGKERVKAGQGGRGEKLT